MSTSTSPQSFVTAGRPKLHANGAARLAEYRKRNVRVDVTLPQAIGETLASISSDLDCSRNELLGSLIRYALTNRNWRVLGLYGSKK